MTVLVLPILILLVRIGREQVEVERWEAGREAEFPNQRERVRLLAGRTAGTPRLEPRPSVLEK